MTGNQLALLLRSTLTRCEQTLTIASPLITSLKYTKPYGSPSTTTPKQVVWSARTSSLKPMSMLTFTMLVMTPREYALRAQLERSSAKVTGLAICS